MIIKKSIFYLIFSKSILGGVIMPNKIIYKHIVQIVSAFRILILNTKFYPTTFNFSSYPNPISNTPNNN